MESLAELRKRILGEEAVAEEEREVLPVRLSKSIELTAEELLRLAADNPTHPFAKVYAVACRRRKPKDRITVDKVDLEALSTNREVVEETKQEGGKTVIRKKLGDKLPTPEPAQAPRPKKEEAKA
jgi:hypothetical protein